MKLVNNYEKSGLLKDLDINLVYLFLLLPSLFFLFNFYYFSSDRFGTETRNLPCAEVHSGRFLSIYLDHNGILSLCEVQVFGCKWSQINLSNFIINYLESIKTLLVNISHLDIIYVETFSRFFSQNICKQSRKYDNKWNYSGRKTGCDQNSVRNVLFSGQQVYSVQLPWWCSWQQLYFWFSHFRSRKSRRLDNIFNMK